MPAKPKYRYFMLLLVLLSGPGNTEIMIGAYLPTDGWSKSELQKYEKYTGRNLAFLNIFTGFSYDWGFLHRQSANSYAEGAAPMITWMPIDSSRKETNILPEILSGYWDDYIDKWARALMVWVESYPEFERPTVLLRFGHEFNGDWYSYGNSPILFTQSWRYVHSRFEALNANQYIEWIWCANYVSDDLYNNIQLYYPGDKYVDWTALDGYNWGSNYRWTKWRSFLSIFMEPYNYLVSHFPTKPIFIAEVASAEPGDIPEPARGQYGDDSDALESKGSWISAMARDLVRFFPAVRAVSIFNVNKELSWSLYDSNSTGLSQFVESYDNGVYTSRFISSEEYSSPR